MVLTGEPFYITPLFNIIPHYLDALFMTLGFLEILIIFLQIQDAFIQYSVKSLAENHIYFEESFSGSFNELLFSSLTCRSTI